MYITHLTDIQFANIFSHTFFQMIFWGRKFMFTTKVRERYTDFPYMPWLYSRIIFPTSQNGTILPRMNLPWHIIITHSPQYTWGLTLDSIHSTALTSVKSVYCHTEYFHYSKILCTPPVHLSFQVPGNYYCFAVIKNFTFSEMSYYRNYNISIIKKYLASVTSSCYKYAF